MLKLNDIYSYQRIDKKPYKRRLYKSKSRRVNNNEDYEDEIINKLLRVNKLATIKPRGRPKGVKGKKRTR